MTDGLEESARAKPPRRFDITVGSLIGDDEQVVIVARPSLLMVPLAALGSLDAIYADLEKVATLEIRGARSLAAKLETGRDDALLSRRQQGWREVSF